MWCTWVSPTKWPPFPLPIVSLYLEGLHGEISGYTHTHTHSHTHSIPKIRVVCGARLACHHRLINPYMGADVQTQFDPRVHAHPPPCPLPCTKHTRSVLRDKLSASLSQFQACGGGGGGLTPKGQRSAGGHMGFTQAPRCPQNQEPTERRRGSPVLRRRWLAPRHVGDQLRGHVEWQCVEIGY